VLRTWKIGGQYEWINVSAPPPQELQRGVDWSRRVYIGIEIDIDFELCLPISISISISISIWKKHRNAIPCRTEEL
jgi:hypothetical protein